MKRTTTKSQPLCEFAGDENTVQGRIVRCPFDAVAIMRLRTIDAIGAAKPKVCQRHLELMISAKVRAAGREWQVDHFLDEAGRKEM